MLRKLVVIGLSVFMIAVLAACGVGQAPDPTSTPVDLTAIYNASLATAQAQMSLVAPTLEPTFTLTAPPSETPTQEASAGEASATPDSAANQETPVLAPSETPFGATAIPSFTPVGAAGGGSSGGSSGNETLCKNAAFDGDVTIPDGTEFSPWEKFRKIWKVRNTGTCTWDEGFYFAAIDDNAPSMGRNQGPYKFRTTKDFVGPGEAVDIAIDMYAPGDPGEYIAHWHMFDDNGQPFGSDFTVVIKVVK